MPLKFEQQGIRYAELSEEEKDLWDATEWALGDFLVEGEEIDQLCGLLEGITKTAQAA